MPRHNFTQENIRWNEREREREREGGEGDNENKLHGNGQLVWTPAAVGLYLCVYVCVFLCIDPRPVERRVT